MARPTKQNSTQAPRPKISNHDLDSHPSATSPSHAAFIDARVHIRNRVLGQTRLIERLLVCLLSDGHLLVEGAPGLAKTSVIKSLADCIEGSFHRIQFTPDLLPADVTGSDIYRPKDADFEFNHGPVFHNLLLADEINRAPAKVQSALLEAMQERQVTVGQRSWKLPDPFIVMATQNPIEQEGTYPLPEAQLDRFMLRVEVSHPDAQVEQDILVLNHALAAKQIAKQIDQQHLPATIETSAPNDTALSRSFLTAELINDARQAVLNVFMAPLLQTYLVDLVVATRQLDSLVADMQGIIRLGASSRATMALDRGARALAWLDGRDHVQPQDVQQLAQDVLCHRILLSFEAQANNIKTSDVVSVILESVQVP